MKTMALNVSKLTMHGWRGGRCIAKDRVNFLTHFDLLIHVLNGIKGLSMDNIEQAAKDGDRVDASFYKFNVTASRSEFIELAKKYDYWCECCNRFKPRFKAFLELALEKYY